jgi:hypothetical protein
MAIEIGMEPTRLSSLVQQLPVELYTDNGRLKFPLGLL